MISSLNDQLAVRILELTAPRFDLAGLALCWLGMGSEGRSEQTIATDQDNGLIFAANDGELAPDAVRERLLPFARAVNEAMDRCGYPLCKGGVMAMNPRWCASLDEWKAAFANWIDRGDPDSLLAASIFFDFRALWGEARLADALRADIAARARANSRFLKQMSDNALRNRPPLNWRGELQAAEDDSGVEGIDLKMSGSVPFVDAARIFALAAGVTATNTVERLHQAGAQRGIPRERSARLVRRVRVRAAPAPARAASPRAGEHGDGRRCQPQLRAARELADLDRRILKEAMRADPQDAAAPRSSTIPDERRRFASLRALASRRHGAAATRRATAIGALGRRRHGDLGPRPAARPSARDRRRRRRRRRHPARRQFRDRAAQRRRPATRRTSPCTASATGRRPRARRRPPRLAAFRDWAADAPRVGFHADFDRAVLRNASPARRHRRPTTSPWLDLAPLAAALAPDAYRRGEPQSRRLARRVRHRMHDPPQRRRRRARDRRAAVAPARDRGASRARVGFDALVRTARAAEMAGRAD